MTDRITLLDLQGTYKRVASRIYRLLEDGYDFAVDEQMIATLDRDALIVDAAFFGQIENRLNELAMRRIGSDEVRQQAMRDAKFTRRLERALPDAESASTRQEIEGWYGVRSDVAHGKRLTYSFDLATIFERAFQLDALVSAHFDTSFQNLTTNHVP